MTMRGIAYSDLVARKSFSVERDSSKPIYCWDRRPTAGRLPIRLQRDRQIGHMALPCASNSIHSRRCAWGEFRAARLPRTAVQTAHNSIFTTVPIIKPSNSVKTRRDTGERIGTTSIYETRSQAKFRKRTGVVPTCERGAAKFGWRTWNRPWIPTPTKGSTARSGATQQELRPEKTVDKRIGWY